MTANNFTAIAITHTHQTQPSRRRRHPILHLHPSHPPLSNSFILLPTISASRFDSDGYLPTLRRHLYLY
jgi:hypothetical protein